MTGSGPSGPATGSGATVTDLDLKKALSRFVSGITVVTTRNSGDPADVHGMTANAFTAVSLHPPLVLVSVATSATSDRLIGETGRYGVSILGVDQEPLSRHFAGGAQRPDLVRFVWRDGLPLLDGALAHLACTVRQSHRAGDHTLHVGEVTDVWSRAGQPLVYFRSGTRRLETIHHDDPSELRRFG